MGAFGNVYPDDQNPLDRRWATYTGIYYANSTTKITHISDGTSNTLAFGEYLGGVHNNGTRFAELAWMGAGCLPTKWGLAPIYGPQKNDYYYLQFQSKHDGVVNFAFADGHVAGISRTATFFAYIRASGMADGLVFDLDN